MTVAGVDKRLRGETLDASQATPAQVILASPAQSNRLHDEQQQQAVHPQTSLARNARGKGRPSTAPLTTSRLDMTELVEYIHTHEEPFKNQNRLASLYSDFRGQQHTNPDGYAANLNAWRKALEHAARAGKVPGSGQTRNLLIIDTGSELARALQHKQHGLPTCLREVLIDAIGRNAFVPVKDWEASTQSIYRKSWINLPKIPSLGAVLLGLWEMGKRSILGPSSELPTESYVLVANVEAAAEAVLARYRQQPHTSAADCIFSRAAFRKSFGEVMDSGVTITARDLDVLLVHLARDRQELSYDSNTIKFKADGEDRPLQVTPEDAALAELHDAIQMVKARVIAIQADANKCTLAIKEALQLKQMVRAKHCLRKKKMAESSLEHYTNLTLQLEESYAKLQQAADQVGIVEAMKAGAEAMATLNKKIGGVEGVQKVVDAVNDEIATTEEITNIINESADPIDENEIEDELAELEKLERERAEREEATKTAELLSELPAVSKVLVEGDSESDGIASQLSTVELQQSEAQVAEERVSLAA